MCPTNFAKGAGTPWTAYRATTNYALTNPPHETTSTPFGEIVPSMMSGLHVQRERTRLAPTTGTLATTERSDGYPTFSELPPHDRHASISPVAHSSTAV